MEDNIMCGLGLGVGWVEGEGVAGVGEGEGEPTSRLLTGYTTSSLLLASTPHHALFHSPPMMFMCLCVMWEPILLKEQLEEGTVLGGHNRAAIS